MSNSNEPVKIVITDRFGPNFIWHMLAVARISYDSNYANKYQSSVYPHDLAFLKYNGWLLWIDTGEPSPLANSFVFLPAWLKLETRGEFREYFNIVRRVLISGDTNPIIKRYSEADWSDPIMKHVRQGIDFPDDADQNFHDLFRRTAEIFMNSVNLYREQVWPEAKKSMAQRLQELSDFVARNDLIAKWEQFLGITFKARIYEFVLCFANKGGPDANSIGYSSNLFYYDKPLEQTCQLLSHEIGTHLLMETLFELISTEQYDRQHLYAAFECLSKFYNRIILGTDDLVYPLTNMNEEHIVPFYEKVYSSGMSHHDLLIQAVEAFPKNTD